ncbi:Zinc finger and SCAN domain-containing protein 29 [Chelonia mydas]|uniref:Zinc finger and SCAN domain-containing protein 29 n=1 Tax=Chelonia mydas TaxID=8469 RepID=M7AWI8_CHEMY|nr:Zinc finger and SCAN domain-containing protein 29 [Chelonia mydas]
MGDLIVVWGEESVQAELRSSRRSAHVYAKITRGLREKGYMRDTQQCCVKIKELRQVYQKAREANSCSGAEPNTCQFDNKLHAILGGEPTSTPTRNMDTSQVCESRDNKEDYMLDEKEEEKDNGRQASGGSILPKSQEIFLTLEPCGSQNNTVADRDAREGTSGEYTVKMKV